MIISSKNIQIIILTTLPFLLLTGLASAQGSKSNYLNFKNPVDLQNFFKYNKNSDIIISGHRGGGDLPENSIEGMQNILNIMPAIFEIDPRLTKDSVVVLMHDAALDRTTTATGLLSNYNLADLKSVKLKNPNGNITSYKIPTLEETIIWSKGKTIINLDKKDVPLSMIADLIQKHKAEKHVMLTVHTGAQARYYYDRFPKIMLSAFIRNKKELEDMEISGVPWANMIAYVGRTIDDQNEEIVNKLRSYGVKCMISVAPTHDKLKEGPEQNRLYLQELQKRPDIIESDFPDKIWNVLKMNKK